MAETMPRDTERQVADLADSYITGQMSRRVFVTRLLALGLTTSVAGAVLAACSSGPSGSSSVATTGTPGATSSAVPSYSTTPIATGLTGNVRFFMGPWSADEDKHQAVIASAFQQLNPGVKFDLKLWDWNTADQQVTSSLTANAADVYYMNEGMYIRNQKRTTGFTDLTSRINDPTWAAEKAKYLYWDRVMAYGAPVIGLPLLFHMEDALFVNLDKLTQAGLDETIVNSWDTFGPAVQKLTTQGTYGLGIGIQLGPTYCEWYQQLVSAGGSFLTPDFKDTNIVKPDVIAVTQRFRDQYDKKIAPPIGTYDYDTAPAAFVAGRLAIYSSDLGSVGLIAPLNPTFNWKLLPYPPGPVKQALFNDMGFYGVASSAQDQDLCWEVVKWWTGGSSSAYWCGITGTYPARTDADADGYDSWAAPQLINSFSVLPKYAFGPEPFEQWSACETAAETEVGNCWSGAITAEQAVTNVDKAIRKIVFG